MALFGSKSVLGVDLGTTGIKIAELSRSTAIPGFAREPSTRSGPRFDLKNYGIIDFLATGEAATGLGDDLLIGGLRDLIGRVKPGTKDAVASISSFLTFATVVEMPYLSAKDLERAIPFEARKYIPIPLSEVVLDWSIINVREISQYENSSVPTSKVPQSLPKPAEGAELPSQRLEDLRPEVGTSTRKSQVPNVEVFLAAVPKSEAERYKNIFLSAGLNLRALELENIALARSLIGDDPSPLAVVNLGGRSTSIIVVDKGFERISRNYELGGFEVTKALAASLGIGYARAEELKKTEGLKGNSSFTEAITPLIDLIVFEARKTMSNYEESKKTKIAKIVLTGGQSNMPGLKEYFGQKLGREILIGDPLDKISFNKILEGTLKSMGPSLSVALGLAMRKI